MKKKAKLSKAKIISIAVAAVLMFCTVAIIITNIFIPVKYLSSYTVKARRAKAGVMRIRFVDVGYGDCTIIELPDGKNMLIDGGDGRYSNQSRILKLLNSSGIDTIDYLVCTSVNSEHCGGLAEIIKYKSVKHIYMPYCDNSYITDEYRSFYKATKECNTVISEYNTGVREEDYFFTFLSPHVKEMPDGEYDKLNTTPTVHTRNNASAVLWLQYGDCAFAFLSDVEAEVLEDITLSYELIQDDYPVQLEKCKVVTLACHGNKNSACAQFYQALSPETAILSVGKNGHGCPSAQALTDVINFVGDRLYRTDECGTTTIEVTAEGYSVK